MYDKDNIFARILNNKTKCEKVYEDKYTLIFNDSHPVAPIHLLAIPKGTFRSFDHFTLHGSHNQILSFFISIRKVIYQYKIDQSGYRLISNNGENAMQTVGHFHIHIVAGKKLGPLVVDDKYHTNK